MIRGLRRSHWVIWTVLAVALPVLFVAALNARREVPKVDRLQGPLEAASVPTTDRSPVGRIELTGAALDLHLVARGNDASLISLKPDGTGMPADLVVYWSKTGSRVGDPLPPAAMFLGSLGNGATLLVPRVGRKAAEMGGFLSLFSESQRTVVGQADLSSFPIEAD